MPAQWVYGAIVLLFVLHGVALLYTYRNSRRDLGGEASGQHVREDGVECANCAALNEPGYRYCRECVSELPGQTSLLGDDSTPQERRTM